MANTPAAQKLQGMIGLEGKPRVVDLDRTAVKRFLEAIDDPNQLWRGTDDRPVAVPPHIFCATMLSGRATWPEFDWPFKRGLDGGLEWHLDEAPKLGDVITSTTRLAEVVEREGKGGVMCFVTCETSHRNQNGVVIGKSRSTLIGMEPI